MNSEFFDFVNKFILCCMNMILSKYFLLKVVEVVCCKFSSF